MYLDEELKKIRTNCINRSETFQPLIAIIGDDISKTYGSYDIVDSVTYKFDNPIRAVDVCFQLFHTLNCKYPQASQLAWQFIQQYVYGIKLASDINYTGIECLVSDLKL